MIQVTNTIKFKQMKTYIVDSFTNESFKGNPAGVCILESSLSDEIMQLIAMELGLSETAFIKKDKSEDYYSIRYFSPKMEIPLCGHATLASSKVLFDEYGLQEVTFKNIQDLDLNIKNINGQILMEFPVYKTTPEEAPVKLLDALEIDKIINSEYNAETNILLIEIESAKVLKNMKPDFQQLFESTKKYNGVLITAKSINDGYDFHSRYFWPWSGTFEDPVTGGTHTFLTPYWSKRLDKTKMKSFQSSERTGFMEVELISDNKFTIKGPAVIVLKGELKTKEI